MLFSTGAADHPTFGTSACGEVWMWQEEGFGLALETALRIKAGVIWVNSHNLFDEVIPWPSISLPSGSSNVNISPGPRPAGTMTSTDCPAVCPLAATLR